MLHYVTEARSPGECINLKKGDVRMNKVPCREKIIMSLDDCEPCPKKSKCRKYLIVKHFGSINEKKKAEREGRKEG